jgi:hypothetical protein
LWFIGVFTAETRIGDEATLMLRSVDSQLEDCEGAMKFDTLKYGISELLELSEAIKLSMQSRIALSTFL